MKRKKWLGWIASLTLCHTIRATDQSTQRPIKVASKQFTESVILGEIVRQLFLHRGGALVDSKAELGGTRILWNSLRNGDIDIYPEYTGTLFEELIPNQKALNEAGLRMSPPLGFKDTYALGMKKSRALKWGIRSISDLKKVPSLKFGLSSEFRQRKDGWPKLLNVYGLSDANVRGLDHNIAYRALQSGDIDILDLYSTDAEISYYDLLTLEDDRKVFPDYDAILVYRADLERDFPAQVNELQKLSGLITTDEMIAMNAEVKLQKRSESQVAEKFLRSKLNIESSAPSQSIARSIFQRLKEHLKLVAISLLLALFVGLPLGIVAAKNRIAGQVILSLVSALQTIPALALLVMLIQPLKAVGLSGIGDTPAIVALFLYSLLPIVRNTSTGLRQMAPDLVESARALGLGFWNRLILIEMPLASPMILAGIKTAVVINVGFATLGALVGAGGFGQPILTGIRLDDYGLILQGAVPAALLALAMQALFDLFERLVVPRGLQKP